MTTDAPADEGAVSRRERAVARVVDPARERAETKVQALLDAALELINTSGQDFTVQEVIERSGQSLRSFYQYFDGKYELLLALFEDAVRSSAVQLTEEIASESTPLDQLHRFATVYYHQCQPGAKSRSSKRAYPSAFANFAHQLLTEHPAEATKAFIPVKTMFVMLLDEAAAAGAIRGGLEHETIAGVILQAIMFNAFATTISGGSGQSADDPAEQLWDLLFHGLASSARS